MINNETCSDIVFLLKDNNNAARVHANKGLLIGRSKYFEAMFRSDMKENRENKVKIKDCSKTVFLLFLEYRTYLYKGDVVDIGIEEAKDLYYVLSDRYQEDDLSSKCLLEVIE